MATENTVITKEELEKQGMILPKNISDTVYNTIANYEQTGVLSIPKNYNVGSALKSAWIKIQNDSKLASCEPTSIANSMLDMVILGLNPARTQCYFVPMGNKCTLMSSYFGKEAVVKRMNGILDIRSDVIYKGTKYELYCDKFGNDNIRILQPCPLETRKPENIIAAWCKIIMDENVTGTDSYCCIMTIDDIKEAWKMNRGGIGSTHNRFSAEMAKKSVIARCTKNYINTLDDGNNIVVEALNRSTANEYQYEEEQSMPKEEFRKEQTINAEDLFEAEYEESEVL